MVGSVPRPWPALISISEPNLGIGGKKGLVTATALSFI